MRSPLLMVLLLALAFNLVTGYPSPQEEEESSDSNENENEDNNSDVNVNESASESSDEIAGFELHDDAYCNNESPGYMSIKDTECNSVSHGGYAKAVNWKDDLAEDAIQGYGPGDCSGNGQRVPWKDQPCTYFGNLGGMRINYQP